MKLSWKKITTLPNNVLEKDTEEVAIIYEERPHRKKKEKKQKRRKGKKLASQILEEKWFPDTGQGQLVVDVYEDEEKNVFVLKSAIAGARTEDIDITVEPDLIVIQGKREKEKAHESRHYYYSECFWGSFSRTLVLPARVMPDHVKASLKNGILTIILPKAKEDKENGRVEIK